MSKQAPLHTAFAACTFELQAEGAAIQLFPAGAFKARDGRPADVEAGHWLINADIAARVLAKAAARITDFVVDYEHQTLNSERNGQPAPAAGWIKGIDLEWREGQGLFATAPQWTEKGAAFIKAREYRYLSPVFTYDTRTGAVLELRHVAITNDPALDGMDSLPALAAARFQLADPAAPSAEENHSVNREQLIALLGLASDASDEDIQTALNTVKGNSDKLPELQSQLAAAKANPDPAQFAPLSVVEELKKDLVALKSDQIGRDVEELVQAGLSDGRLLPAQEKWARDLGGKDVAALKTYLADTPVIAALKRQQTDGRVPVPTSVEQLDDEATAVCRQLGVDPKDYLATLKA
ncbi:phage protease [Pseudomonas sp. F(2018)]|uniref:phage protease n=1 Tax=Pseudomonas sp. F(2018) TaxID=2502240 RepID=UPI0010F7B491|nr:phage protease [Pseudomonas sp. F(2018)]